MKKNRIIILTFSIFIFTACTTTRDLEKESQDFVKEEVNKLTQEEIEEEAKKAEEYQVYEKLKVQDIEDTVIYIERPVYVPQEVEKSKTDKKKVKGYDAVAESLKSGTVEPEFYKMGTFWYQYNENLVYEIYGQPYHLTDIILEPGEIVIGTPKLSEDESAWELTADVGKDVSTGLDVQHLYIKPAYSKQDASMIIVTDRRVYHFRLRSFSDTHMAMVKFRYPQTVNKWLTKDETKGRSLENNLIRISNPENISVDYKIKYSTHKVPEFLPKLVYDDGRMTYIQVDEIVLQKKLPVVFNEKNEIVNYTVDKNVFVIPRLINKITLKLGKEKVIVEKKKTKTAKNIDKENLKEEVKQGSDNGK